MRRPLQRLLNLDGSEQMAAKYGSKPVEHEGALTACNRRSDKFVHGSRAALVEETAGG
jgi:hypothetical protein